MIKNAFLFRLIRPLSTEALNRALEKRRFQDIGDTESATAGFTPFQGDSELDLVHAAGGIRVGAVRIDKRTIPGSTLKQRLQTRCDQLQAQQGFAPGRKQKRDLKDALILELLPHILPTSKVVNFFLWDDLLAIDTTSPATADGVIGLFAKCVDPFPIASFSMESTPAAGMTDWVVSGEPPSGFTIDQEVEMLAIGESRASVRWKNQSIDQQEAQDHVKQGKVCSKAAMTWADKLSFVLTGRGNLARIKPLDVLQEAAPASSDDAIERLDGEIALIGGELRKLVADLVEALGGYAPLDDDDTDDTADADAREPAEAQ